MTHSGAGGFGRRAEAWANGHPLVFAVGLTLLQIALAAVVLELGPSALPGWDPIQLRIVFTCLMALIAAALLHMLRFWREAGFVGPANWRNNWAGALATLLCFAPLLFGVRAPDGNELIVLIPGMIVNSFAEEAVFRGLALAPLARTRPIRAALVTAALFGSVHLIRLLFGASIEETIPQVVLATLIGILLAGVWLRTGTIWWPILIHTAANIVPTMANPAPGYGEILGAGIVIAGVALSMLLLWQARQEHKRDQASAP